MSFLDDARTAELWAKVKAALAGKQPKLTGTAGQVVGFGAKGAAQAVAGWSNQSLIINGYFLDPANQRGQTEYTGRGYTIDCWKDRYVNGDGVKELTEAGIHLKPGFATNGLMQVLETFKHLSGKTVTFSVFVPSVSGTLRAHIAGYDSSDAYQTLESSDLSAPGILQLTTTLPDISDYLEFFVRIYNVTAGTDSVIAAAKLELGSHQTLAHQDANGNWVLNDPPPDKALELAKCQRYQIELVPKFSEQYGIIGTGKAISETTASIFVPLPVSMRTTAAVVYRGKFVLRDTEGAVASSPVISNINDVNAMSHAVRLQAVSDGLVPGKEYMMWYVPSEDTSSFFLDANL